MLVDDLGKQKGLSSIGQSIAASGRYLDLTRVMMTAFSVALLIGFALLVI